MPHLSPLAWGFILWLVVFSCIVMVIFTYWSGPIKFSFNGGEEFFRESR